MKTLVISYYYVSCGKQESRCGWMDQQERERHELAIWLLFPGKHAIVF